MSEELDRIRDLRGDAPGPSAGWVRETRHELLQMAAAEQDAAAAGQPATTPSTWHQLLTRLVAPPRLAWAAVAAIAVAAVALAAGVLGDRGTQGPPVANPEGRPSPTTTASAAPSPSGPPASPTAAPGGVQLAAGCEGADGLYAIEYPADWHTPSAGAVGHCEEFDAQPLTVEQGTGGGPFGAVTIRPLPIDLAVAADPGRAHREISAEETTVDGRRAVRTVWESTGGAALPEGLRSYRYLIDLDDHVLLAAVYDVDDTDFTERRQLLDAMVASLQLRDGRVSP